nr:N-acetylmuramoyl-L-alanine amidase [Enterococcus faecalis]
KGSFQGNSVSFSTKEADQRGQLYTISAGFRDYGGYNDSLQDYVQLLRQGIDGNQDFYKPAWRSEAKNYLQATRFLTGKYATDKQYDNKLNSLIAVYNLTQF